MPVPNPQKRSVDFLKTKIMQPALTSHFECYFALPGTMSSWFRDNQLRNYAELTETLTISCSDASLPGSTLATHELNNDFTGVTQRHAYRRLYDDRADFTFYVNNKYEQIRLFEAWMRYITGEQISTAANLNISYRVQYPKTYKTTIYITKFERDLQAKRAKNPQKIVYSFFNAFPVSVSSMPISYDSSQLLKCTVSFSYDRYVCSNNSLTPPSSSEPSQNTTAGVPDLPGLTGAGALATGNESVLFNNISLTQYNISPGTLTNSYGEGEEIIDAINSNQRPVEEGLPYVGRNVGPLAP